MSKIITKFNYPVLRTGDMVLFCSSSFVAMIIRCFSSGWHNWNNYNIPNHVGQIVEVEGQKLVAEMLSNGLNVRSLEFYNKKKERSWPKVIKRNPVYDNEDSRKALNARIFKDLRYTLDYDFKGLLEFVIKRVNDDKSRAYCSEYFYQQTKQDGVIYPASFETKVSPYDLDMLSNWVVVPNWKL